MDAKSKKMLFVGYSLHHKAYLFIDPETFKINMSRDCRFLTHREVCETKPSQGSTVFFPFSASAMNKADDDPVIVAPETGNDETPTTTFSDNDGDHDNDECSDLDFDDFNQQHLTMSSRAMSNSIPSVVKISLSLRQLERRRS